MGGETSSTRLLLHLVATHVMARRRHQVSGRFGLRSTPGGIATPAFGPEPEALRTAGLTLVRERGGESSYAPMGGSTLARLAAFAGADLSAPFDAGKDAPQLGDPDVPLRLEPEAADRLAEWWALGYRVLDAVIGSLSEEASPATIQIWPEHFDAGTTVLVGAGRVNLGYSPGDSWCDEPYAYIGPRGPGRPGDPAFWNAPFGAYITWADLSAVPVEATCREFFQTGLHYLKGEARGQSLTATPT